MEFEIRRIDQSPNGENVFVERITGDAIGSDDNGALRVIANGKNVALFANGRWDSALAEGAATEE